MKTMSSSAGEDQEMVVLEETIVEDVAGEEMSDASLDSESDGDAFSFTDESILSLEAEFDSSSDYLSEESAEDNAELSIEDELFPEIILGDDEDTPTDNYLSSKDEIPDISLEELGSIRFGDEADAETSFTEEEEIDSYMTSAVVDELAGTDIVLGDEIASKPIPPSDEIDWDKEAEDMEDINLDDVKKTTGSFPIHYPAWKMRCSRQEQAGNLPRNCSANSIWTTSNPLPHRNRHDSTTFPSLKTRVHCRSGPPPRTPKKKKLRMRYRRKR